MPLRETVFGCDAEAGVMLGRFTAATAMVAPHWRAPERTRQQDSAPRPRRLVPCAVASDATYSVAVNHIDSVGSRESGAADLASLCGLHGDRCG
jgi:hypothetical protein